VIADGDNCPCGVPASKDISLCVVYLLDGAMHCADTHYCSAAHVPHPADYVPADAEIVETVLTTEAGRTVVADGQIRVTADDPDLQQLSSEYLMAEENCGDGPGTIYLVHFDRPYKHARHYTGWTRHLLARLLAHREGHGARLMEVIKDAGITFRLVRTWTGPRARERAIKDRKNAPALCPECSAHPFPVTSGRAAARAPARVREPVPAWPPPEWAARQDDYAEYDDIVAQLVRGWRAERHMGRGRNSKSAVLKDEHREQKRQEQDALALDTAAAIIQQRFTGEGELVDQLGFLTEQIRSGTADHTDHCAR